MPASRRNAITERFFRIHPWIYRKTGGRVLGRFGGTPILLLETRGRKSGQTRTNGLMYLDRGNSWAVAASWAGEPKHPLWYLNLVAQPEATIQVQDRRIPVRARELEGDERALVWKEIVAQDPSFALYEERTQGIREIPVVVLEPRDTDASPPQEDALVLYGKRVHVERLEGRRRLHWKIASAPYRADCFNELKQRFARLDREAKRDVCALLPEAGIALLEGPITPVESATDRRGRRGRLGRPAALFD